MPPLHKKTTPASLITLAAAVVEHRPHIKTSAIHLRSIVQAVISQPCQLIASSET